MRNLILYGVLALSSIAVLPSCKTYSIPVSDFKKLFEGKDLTKDYSFRAPTNMLVSYKIYPFDSIRCIDKKGKYAFVRNSRSLEIRVVDMSNQKHDLFFHSIRIRDSLLVGTETLEANDWQLSWETSSPDPLSTKPQPRKTTYHRIPLDSIKKVTVIKW